MKIYERPYFYSSNFNLFNVKLQATGGGAEPGGGEAVSLLCDDSGGCVDSDDNLGARCTTGLASAASVRFYLPDGDSATQPVCSVFVSGTAASSCSYDLIQDCDGETGTNTGASWAITCLENTCSETTLPSEITIECTGYTQADSCDEIALGLEG